MDTINPSSRITPAVIQWRDDGLPYSPDYGDIYFSGENPAGESAYVFLEQNALAQRWRELGGGHFVIGETGFGFGLNFVSTCQLWEQVAAAGACLDYVSCERHPVTVEDLRRLCGRWPHLRQWYERLLGQYRDHSAGIQLLQFDTPRGARIRLTLLFGDASASFQAIYQARTWRVDAWFLDGFAPSRNPGMWQEALFQALAALSKPGTSFSTYTVAGKVRRGLEAVGFSIEKAKGHGGKRQMLKGCYQTGTATALRSRQPWFCLPASRASRPSAVVVGAGMAGCVTAYTLAERGWQVTLIDKASVASGASGNSQGIVHLKLGKVMKPATQFMLQAYLHAIPFYQRLAEANPGVLHWHGCGQLQLSFNERTRGKALEALRDNTYEAAVLRGVDQTQASALAGITMALDGLHFPLGGWLDPRALCQVCCSHPAIETRLGLEVKALQRQGDEWSVLGGSTGTQELLTLATAPVVIVANALQARQLEQLSHYPLGYNSGQVSWLRATSASRTLKTIICSNGYLLPCHDGQHSLGGSFVSRSLETTVSESAHQRNLGFLAQLAPGLFDARNVSGVMGGRAAVRCSVPDHLPVVGPVEDRAAFVDDYGVLARNARKSPSALASYRPGLFVNIAHGSHGLTSVPLAAEYLAAMICGEVLPLQNPLLEAIHPARFLLRDLRRQQTDHLEQAAL